MAGWWSKAWAPIIHAANEFLAEPANSIAKLSPRSEPSNASTRPPAFVDITLQDDVGEDVDNFDGELGL